MIRIRAVVRRILPTRRTRRFQSRRPRRRLRDGRGRVRRAAFFARGRPPHPMRPQRRLLMAPVKSMFRSETSRTLLPPPRTQLQRPTQMPRARLRRHQVRPPNSRGPGRTLVLYRRSPLRQPSTGTRSATPLRTRPNLQHQQRQRPYLLPLRSPRMPQRRRRRPLASRRNPDSFRGSCHSWASVGPTVRVRRWSSSPPLCS